MAGAAGGLQVEACDGIAPGDDAAIGPAGFRDQHVFVAGGLGLDHVAGRGAADFLIWREEEGDRQFGLNTRTGQLADGFERKVVAALHVEDRGAVAFLPIATERQL